MPELLDRFARSAAAARCASAALIRVLKRP
jgi:hypothetical protein